MNAQDLRQDFGQQSEDLSGSPVNQGPSPLEEMDDEAEGLRGWALRWDGYALFTINDGLGLPFSSGDEAV